MLEEICKKIDCPVQKRYFNLDRKDSRDCFCFANCSDAPKVGEGKSPCCYFCDLAYSFCAVKAEDDIKFLIKRKTLKDFLNKEGIQC